MAFNIMDLISEQITPDNIAIVTKFTGVDSPAMSKAIAAAIPLLLGNILASTSEPDGKERFNKAIDKAGTGLPGNLFGAAGDDGSSEASAGRSMPGALLGESKLNAITSAISGFSGISTETSASLLGVATPMLMSILSKKKQQHGLDCDGLLSMLDDQKSNMTAALTPEMSHYFAGPGVIDGFADQAKESIESAAGNVTDTAGHAGSEDKSLFKKLFPVVALTLLAWLAYQFFTKPSAETGPPRSPITGQISPAVK
ncbi:MAG: DUF937 domain-containing protein [Pseudomonadota bacterium]|nr:DUF937 domain-containing protein [Pseudomonadota bacterium]